MQNVLAILLAGGAGERLSPLTLNTAKPAVPFGGAYRIIDFTLSNCINSDIRRVFILTQYKALELTRHIREGWNIFSGDQIYKMDYHEMVDQHCRQHADVTIATIQIPPSEAPRFGIVKLDDSCRVVGFEEKPQHGNPTRSVFNPEMVSASMGIYVFNTEVLLQALLEDSANADSAHA